jgi:uncharacterized protein
MMEITLAGEEVVLFAERGMYWKRKGTLLVADTHWGKAATLRSAGLPIPGGTTRADLERLSLLVRRTGAGRIVFLGDAIHARQGRAVRTLGAVAEWRAAHSALDLVLVRGNHDARAGDPPGELGMRCCDAPLVEEPFVFQHFPAPSELGYALAGHTHPAVKVRGRAGESARLPCFYFTPQCGTLPAFGSLTGCALVYPTDVDRVYGIGDDEILLVE